MLFALVMGAMVVLAAVAVDLGSARQHRRGAQNAADAAALAAAQDLPNVSVAVATVKAYAQSNDDIAPSAWAGCFDPDHLALTPDFGASNNRCISFSNDRTRIRVALPTRDIPTSFGAALGQSSIAISAHAVAGSMVSGDVRIMPTAVTGIVGTGLICVEQSGNNQPCSNRERGQFGSLSVPRLNYFKPSSNVEQTSLAISYAMNLDHALEPFTGSTAVCDGALRSPCTTTNVGSNAVANHVLAATGNSVPPVTEGYVTGFTATTVDEGSVSFCGRLQRPDFTSENLLDPRPGGCNNPGAPTMTILGRTVNGRHIYYWLTPAARQLFYPEVVTLNYADNSPQLVIGGPVFGPSGVGNAGDARLDCFLAGYRWNVATGTETLPTCPGLTYPAGGGSTSSTTVGDHFAARAYTGSSGATDWPTSWVEVGDDNKPTGGKIAVLVEDKKAGNNWLSINASGGTTGLSVGRAVDLSDVTSATLTFSGTSTLDGSAEVVAEVRTSGNNWTTLATFNASSNNVATVYSYPLPSSRISQTTEFRFRITGTGSGSAFLYVDDVEISYEATTAGTPFPVAPIFGPEMQTDPRWGVIPRIGYWPSPNAAPIQGFWAFYGYSTYVTNQKVQAFDGWVFDPALVVSDPTAASFTFGFSPQPFARLLS